MNRGILWLVLASALVPGCASSSSGSADGPCELLTLKAVVAAGVAATEANVTDGVACSYDAADGSNLLTVSRIPVKDSDLLFMSLAAGGYQPLAGRKDVLYKLDALYSSAKVRRRDGSVLDVSLRATGSTSDQTGVLTRLSTVLTAR